MKSLLNRVLVTLLLVFSSASVVAEKLTIERMVASPSLSGPSVAGLKLSPDGKYASYLKGKPENKAQQDLWVYDIASGNHRLLVDSSALVPGERELSEVEKARRERMRITGSGIVEYYWAPNADGLLFPLGGDLYYQAIGKDGSISKKVVQLTADEDFETDVRFSPKGNYVSFIRNQNLVVIELATGKETAITTEGAGSVSYGMAEFVAQEEMKRMTGYWWSPDEQKIAYTRVDESGVKLVDRYEVDATGAVTVIPQHYPFAGTDNARVELAVTSISKPESMVWMKLGLEKNGYLARVKWLPDSERLAVQRQNRAQTNLDLLFFNTANGESKKILSEQSDTWVNLNDDLYFLKEESETQFIWGSERSGFKHLYLFDDRGEQLARLTSGDWSVSSLVGVDEADGTVYFTGNADGVVEHHLYSLSLLGGKSGIKRLTKAEGWHDISYGCRKEGKICSEALFIDRHSSVSRPPNVSLRREDGSLIAWMIENKLDENHPYYPYASDHVTQEFGELKAEDGQVLNYQLFKPKNMKRRAKYPAVVYVYGGPHSQRVKNAWAVDFNQILVQNGYVVLTLDNRGTSNKGTEFEGVIKGKMGMPEVRDQLAGVDFLKSLKFVDNDRIGIYGWSYGGYMTLMNLFQAPTVYKAGVSIAPVTDWLLYDTHYTERYMGVPSKPEDYAKSAVFAHLDNYQSEPNRGKLLLVHGMADDNVFFDNSVKLMSALQQRQLDFQMMAYPGKKHGIRGADTRAHLWKMLLNYFDQELKDK